MDITEITNQITSLQKEIADRKKQVGPLFQKGLKELFKKHPTVSDITISINNHEFNDGDATYFSFYYDDLSVEYKAGREYDAEATDKADSAIQKEFVKFFKQFDVDSFYEDLYSDEHESVTISA